MTLNQISYDLLSLVTHGEVTDDNSLSLLQLEFWVATTRAELIRQSYNKGQSINSDVAQTISCLKVIQIDASECPCEITGCTILRTEREVPTMVETNQMNLLMQVSSNLIGSKPFTIIPYSRAAYINKSKFGKLGTKVFLHNRYLYILTDTYIESINVTGVFNDPKELAAYKSCSGEPCYSEDSYYPISAHMINTLKRMIMDTNFKVYMNTKEDTKNDAHGE